MPPSNLLLASKIVVNEDAPRIRTIPGRQSSIGAFAGVTKRGPIRTPVFVTSFDEAVEKFGSFISTSDLMVAVEGFFKNGGTACWISRVVHYTDNTDSATSTAVKGDQQLLDRGGAASEAVLTSAAGPFELDNGQDLVVDIDNNGADTLSISAAAATAASGSSETYALTNNDTIIYQVKLPGSDDLTVERTITLNDSDALISAIGTVTAQEMVNVINRDGSGIKAVLTAGPSFEIQTDKKGSGASLVISASSTAIGASKLNISSGTTSGSGNVADSHAVTATELAGLLTALPLSAGTATVVDSNKLRLTSDATGASAEVEVTAATTTPGIFAGSLPITENGSAAGTSNTIKVIGKNEGTWINDYSIVIEAATSGDSDRFNLRIKRGTSTVETWPNLSMTTTDDRYVETFINENSIYIDIEDQFSAAVSPADMPALGEFSSWTNQDDGLTGLVDADFIGSDAGDTGLYAFDAVDNIGLLMVPDRATSAVQNAMINYCEVHRLGTVFAILDSPEGLDEQAMKTYFETTAALAGLSEFGAMFWPRVKITNPNTSVYGNVDTVTVAPCGHIAGVMVRTDQSSPGGIYRAPAGIERGILFGVVGFETDAVLDERKRDVVYPARINPLTQINGSPRHIDGTRTLKGDSNFPSIPERRGVIFIERSIKQGLLFAKHRNNDRQLRKEVKRSIEAFLLRQFNNGAFRGATPAESFVVDVGEGINTPERIFAGELHVRVGLATQKPADFIILTFTQDTRELEERLANTVG